MSTPQVSELRARQPTHLSSLSKLPVELWLLTRDFLDLDALIQLRYSGHAGLRLCQVRGQRAYVTSLANMFGLKNGDIATLSSVLRIALLVVLLEDKAQPGRFAEVVTSPYLSEAALTRLLTSGALFSRLGRGTLPVLCLLADQFERVEAAFARTRYNRAASELPSTLKSRFVSGLARYLVASELHQRRSDRTVIHRLIEQNLPQEIFNYYSAWMNQYSAQQLLDILNIVQWFDVQTCTPGQNRFGDILLRVKLGLWLDVYEDRNKDFTCLRGLDVHIPPVLQRVFAAWFVQRKVAQHGADIRKINEAEIRTVGLEPMPTLATELCHICRSPEGASCALWNAQNAQFMQRRHGFSLSSILPLHLQKSLYLQAWVTYFLEDPSRDTYAHLVALHPDLVAPTADLHNANTKSTASSSAKHRPRIGQLPTFQTVGLSIATLVQELVDLPNVVTNSALRAAIDQDAFTKKTENMTPLNINNNCICSDCASGLFVARFWLWVRQRIELGIVPGYDPSRSWCWWGIECQAMSPKNHFQSHLKHAMQFEHFCPRTTSRRAASVV